MSVNENIRAISAAHLLFGAHLSHRSLYRCTCSAEENCPAALGCHDTRNVNSNADILKT